MSNSEDTKIVNLNEYRLVKMEEEEQRIDEFGKDASEALMKLLKQYDFVDERCGQFWKAISEQQRMMAFYVVMNGLFKGNILDECVSFENFMHGYLNIDLDSHPIAEIVVDACGAELVWDTLNAGRDNLRED